MQAIVQRKFGAPSEVLTLAQIDRPEIKDDRVVVRVHAASIHVGDAYTILGVPFVMRPVFRATKADNGVPGTDIAGTVEAVGEDVTALAPGDEVFGWCKGAFAEYAATSEDALARKPANLTFEQASAVGVSAFTALQALRDHGGLESGQTVLVNGASGGVGTFAVQIAKSFGAEVTGVCSTRNVDMVRSIGADHVIDYTVGDFTLGGARYDLILDNVGNHSLSDTRRALTPSGTLLANGSPVGGWFGGLGSVAKILAVSLFVKQQGRPFVSMPNKEDLATLREFAATNEITPVIDRVYPLSDAAEAIDHVGAGHARGTSVLTI
jgi:NADPH:quinone reductase-like Zn-dependent oxidoreductase